jgi:hypothetical protein
MLGTKKKVWISLAIASFINCFCGMLYEVLKTEATFKNVLGYTMLFLLMVIAVYIFLTEIE